MKRKLTDRQRSARAHALAREARAARELRKKREYVTRAKRLAKFVPSLKQYTGAGKITKAAEKKIRARERQLAHAHNLRPVTVSQAKKLRGQLYGPGIRAIQLTNTEAAAKIKVISKDIRIYSNGRTWLYWRLPREAVRSKNAMKKAAAHGFAMEFPIEAIAKLAEKAFKKYKPLGVALWAAQGRVDRTFDTLNQFVRWLNQHWQAGRYISYRTDPSTGEELDTVMQRSDPAKWVNGIAIELAEK